MSKRSSSLKESNTVKFTLEFIGEESSSKKSIRIGQNVNQNGSSIKLRVMVNKSQRVDVEEANRIADLISEKMPSLLSSINSAGNVIVERMKISDIKFTKQGIKEFCIFLSSHAITVRHLMLHNLLLNDKKQKEVSENDKNSFLFLCNCFGSSARLETLDMSNNILGDYVWKPWSDQHDLKSLILNDVEMSDLSFHEMNSAFHENDLNLVELHLSNTVPTGPTACEVTNNLLQSCLDLKSFKWLNKKQPSSKENKDETGSRSSFGTSGSGSVGTVLPITGLAELCKQICKINNMQSVQSIKYLELQGGKISSSKELGDDGLRGTLLVLPNLQTLKLRDVGIDNIGVMKQIVDALCRSRPPLTHIDLASNGINDECAICLATQLSCLKSITKNLKVLNLERNKIGAEGMKALIENFAYQITTIAITEAEAEILAAVDPNNPDEIRSIADVAAKKANAFHLYLNRNSFDSGSYGTNTLQLTIDKLIAEKEREEIREERDRIKNELHDTQKSLKRLISAQTAMVSDMQTLQHEAKKLADDRDNLIKAFSVLGAVQHIEERRDMLDRISKLEEAVMSSSIIGSLVGGPGGAVASTGGSVPNVNLRSSAVADTAAAIVASSSSTPLASTTSNTHNGAFSGMKQTPFPLESGDGVIGIGLGNDEDDDENSDEQLLHPAAARTKKVTSSSAELRARMSSQGAKRETHDFVVHSAKERWDMLRDMIGNKNFKKLSQNQGPIKPKAATLDNYFLEKQRSQQPMGMSGAATVIGNTTSNAGASLAGGPGAGASGTGLIDFGKKQGGNLNSYFDKTSSGNPSNKASGIKSVVSALPDYSRRPTNATSSGNDTLNAFLDKPSSTNATNGGGGFPDRQGRRASNGSQEASTSTEKRRGKIRKAKSARRFTDLGY